MSILITHPGRQHSHQSALALAGTGMLAGYWSGVPSLKRHSRLVPEGIWERFVRYTPLDIPDDLCRWLPAPVIIRNLSRRFIQGNATLSMDFLACRIFDRQVASSMHLVKAEAVSACEISALNIFQKAKALGWKTILDAPQVHHRLIDRLLKPTERPALQKKIKLVKDAEIALADHIITVSEFARQSYINEGVFPEKVHSIPVGADLGIFKPNEGDVPAADGPCRFIFGGAVCYRKGADLLIEAFRRIRTVRSDITLKIAGPMADASQLLKESAINGIEVTGPLSQNELSAEFSRADCFVLPSRLDSFGMVVAEALACGTPVIVSEFVGAKMLVHEGINGWVIPDNSPDVLAERMLWCADHRKDLLAMRSAARASVQNATWERFADDYVALIRRILNNEI